MRGEIKVFAMNDYEWYAGRSVEEVRAHYAEVSGFQPGENTEDARELSGEEMQSGLYHDDDDSDAISFAQQLQRMIDKGTQFPCFFATTEY